MELNGLKGIFLGDSITEGVGASSIDKVWWKLLEQYGMKTVGYGVGGTRIARQSIVINGNDRWNADFVSRALDMDKEADVVGVFGGTNDYGHGTAEIGFPTDDTPDTFYGALNVLFTYLQKTYPDAFIFVMTPLHRLNEDRPTGDGHTKPMLPLNGYVNIIREMAEKYSLPVLDLYKISGMNPYVNSDYFVDGLHPSDKGYAKISGMVYEFLKSSYYKKLDK